MIFLVFSGEKTIPAQHGQDLYLEKWYSTTAETVDGGPRVAAAAEFHGCEEFLGAMWVLPEICSGLCHGGYTTD